MLTETFGNRKPVIAMAHLPPLPGAPLYDANTGMNGVLEYVARDLENLQAGGVDCIMFGNEGDRPYLLSASPQSLAAMAAVVGALKGALRVPFGVNYLWDPVATVALGVATGAAFAREIFTGVYDSDMGLWQPNAAKAVRLRHDLGRDDMKLLFNVNAEFASPIGSRPIDSRAKSAVFSSLADVVLVSGPMTGQPVDGSDLRRVKVAVGDTPVFANTGVNKDNVADILSVADGVIIGTHLKVDGDTWKPVDPERVKRFMEAVERAR
ncbi:MAG TPA: BtpA/SgcQ family protein [Afifellaceae bacterium]|nr:BtpA/SgcQ family protein [Afifellaceae bacterium]